MEHKHKILVGVGIGFGILLIGSALLYRNRYKFLTTDKSILNADTPYKKVQEMGAHPFETATQGGVLRYYKYQFFPNNRVFYSSDGKNWTKKGSYDLDKITWDDKTTLTLDSVFGN